MNIAHELATVRTKSHLIRLILTEGEVFEHHVMGNKMNKGNKKQIGESSTLIEVSLQCGIFNHHVLSNVCVLLSVFLTYLSY